MPPVNKSALYAFNGYTWKVLEANLGWTKVNGKPPIVPGTDEPELQASGKPYIIYGSNIQPTRALWALTTEHISYNIYAPGSPTTGGSSQANTIALLLVRVFERQDESAADINAWTTQEIAVNPNRAGIRFGTVKVLMAEFAEPVDQEGGIACARIMIETKYTVTQDDIQTTGFTV